MTAVRTIVKTVAGAYRQAYSGLPREAWLLFAVNLVNSAGTMVIFFLTLYLTRRMGFTAVEAGRALSLYGVGSLAGAYGGGWLSDRLGSTTVQKLSLVLSGGFLIVLGQLRTPATLFPSIFLFAASNGALFPANIASMSRVCPPELRVKGFALNRLAGNLGVTIGPAVGGLLALHDYRLLFWADGATCLAAAAVFTLIWKKPEQRLRAVAKAESAAEGAPPALSPWRDGPFLLLMLLVFVWSGVFNQLLTTFPLYLRNVYGLAEDTIGRLLAVNTVLIVVLEMVIMEKVRRYPVTRTINISFLLLGLGLGLMPFGRGALYAAFTVAVWTFGEILSMPLMAALIAGRARPETQGRYMGMFSFSYSLSLIVAPVAGTAVYERFGGDVVWYGCFGVTVLIAAAFYRLRPSLAKRKA
ncbi:MAG: MFS transporter [Candidatus Aminicenantes bacterium]|nr:MFS transporter [Candidatus Aminicenantes bacterium]